MLKYSKFFVAAVGIALLIGLQRFQVEIPGLADVVRDLIVGALVAGGVYQVPNQAG
jgi:Na+/H+-dicarboxylate symporter